MKNPEPFKETYDFDAVFLKALNESLTVLGESVKNILLFHMQSRYSLKIEDIPKKPELFALALKSLLGPSSSLIETLIMQKLCAQNSLEFERLKTLPFHEALIIIRERSSRTGLPNHQ